MSAASFWNVSLRQNVLKAFPSRIGADRGEHTSAARVMDVGQDR